MVHLISQVESAYLIKRVRTSTWIGFKYWVRIIRVREPSYPSVLYNNIINFPTYFTLFANSEIQYKLKTEMGTELNGVELITTHKTTPSGSKERVSLKQEWISVLSNSKPHKRAYTIITTTWQTDIHVHYSTLFKMLPSNR